MNTVVIKFSYYDNKFQYFRILKQGSYKKNVSDFFLLLLLFPGSHQILETIYLQLHVSPNYFIPRSLLQQLRIYFFHFRILPTQI